MNQILQLVPENAEPPPAEQCLLRPVLAMLDAWIGIPFRVRMQSRRPREKKSGVIVVPADVAPFDFDLLSWQRPIRIMQRRKRLELGPLTKDERQELLALEAELLEDGLLPRPRTRAECENGIRPCPFASCRHHLWMEILTSGAIKPVAPNLDITEMPETCSLDLAGRSGMEIGEVAQLLNVSIATVQHVETNGKKLLRQGLVEKGARVFLPVID